jgi:hypothetical protein
VCIQAKGGLMIVIVEDGLLAIPKLSPSPFPFLIAVLRGRWEAVGASAGDRRLPGGHRGQHRPGSAVSQSPILWDTVFCCGD